MIRWWPSSAPRGGKDPDAPLPRRPDPARSGAHRGSWRRTSPTASRGSRAPSALAGPVRSSSGSATGTLFFRLEATGEPDQGSYDLEIEVPKLVYEILDLARDRRWQLSIHRGSIQVLPFRVSWPQVPSPRIRWAFLR